jgi:hypothetical protein
MSKCPICKQYRSSNLHTDKCSKIAQKTMDSNSSFIGAYKSKQPYTHTPQSFKTGEKYRPSPRRGW